MTAIALGFAAVNIFGGYTSYMFINLKNSFIYSQGNGHLTIFKKGFLDEGKLDPVKYLIKEDELETIKEVCKSDSRVLLVTPKLQITGLVSNGNVSTIFYAEGRVPSDFRFMRSKSTGMLARLDSFHGNPLQDDVLQGIGLSTGLSKKLNMPIGASGTALSPTVDGMVNALDVLVFQTFESPMEAVNDKLMDVNLAFAQTLYDTKSVDSVTVLLEDTALTEQMGPHLQKLLTDKGLDVEIKNWEEMSHFYRKVRDMFNVIFLFLFLIVFVIVVMSVVNTISMSVLERTREIGTLRALGLKRIGIINLFAVESALMGVFGSAFGALITVVTWWIIKVVEPTWVPPQITQRIPLEVYLAPSYMIASFVFLIILSIGAATAPARKAAHTSIVEALGHT
jgi:putative ABC transport system permease protein